MNIDKEFQRVKESNRELKAERDCISKNLQLAKESFTIELANEKKTSSNRIKSLEKTRTYLQSAIVQSKMISAKHEKKSLTLEKFAEELRVKMNASEQKLSEVGTFKEKNKELIKLLDQKSAEKSKVADLLRTAIEAQSELEIKVLTLERELKSKCRECQRWRRLYDKNRIENERFSVTADKLKEELRWNSEENNRYKRELEKMGLDLKSESNMLIDKARKLDAAVEEISTLKEKLKIATSTKEEAERLLVLDNTKLDGELKATKIKFEEVAETLAKTNTERAQLKELNKKLESELKQMTMKADQLLQNKNFFKKKAESLAKLKTSSLNSFRAPSAISTRSSPSLTAGEIQNLSQQVSELKLNRNAALRALDSYKTALTEERKVNSVLKQKLEFSSDESNLSNQNEVLQRLANDLSENLTDYKRQIDHQKNVIKILGKRVLDLENHKSLPADGKSDTDCSETLNR